MKVLSTQPNGKFSHTFQPSFRNWNRIVYRDQRPTRYIDFDSDGFCSKMFRIKHTNQTAIFRYENYLPDMLDYAVKKFKHKEHVNFYSYGCSNCSEQYSILMYLISKYGEDTAQKFTPIFARDYDEIAILHAKSGVLPINQQEYERIQKYTGGKFEEFFLPDEPLDFSKDENLFVHVNPKYYSMIDIKKADIRYDYTDIPPQNTILTTINFLPYLPDKDSQELVNNIANHLNKKSMWWFGPYELQSGEHLIYKARCAGFSNMKRPDGVYEKVPYPKFERISADILRMVNRLKSY